MNILTQVVGRCPIVSILARVPHLGLFPVSIDDGGSSLRLVLDFLPGCHRVLGHVGEQLRQGLPLLKIRSVMQSEAIIDANLVLLVRMEDGSCPLLYDGSTARSRPGSSIFETVISILSLLLARLGVVCVASLTSPAALETGHHCLGVDAVKHRVEHLEGHLCLLVLVELVYGRRAWLVCPRTEQIRVVSTF